MQYPLVSPSSHAHHPTPPRRQQVRKIFEDDTLPGGPYETTIEYVAPFFKPDREEDYRRAWAFFAKEHNE